MPEFIRFPASMKNGIAVSTKLFIPENIFCTICHSGSPVNTAITTIELAKSEYASGNPSSIRKIMPAKRIIIGSADISSPPFCPA